MKDIGNVVSACDGISIGAHVLKSLGYGFKYHAIEINDIKREISDHNFKGIVRPFNDVTDKDSAEKFFKRTKVDLFLCGPTCTSLSSQGPRTDFDGESKIFFNCVENLEMAKRYNPEIKFLFENVASMKIKCRDIISETLGIKFFKGESFLISPQDRTRYYWFNWLGPINIKDVDNMDAKKFLEDDGLDLVGFTKSNRGRDDNGESIVQGRCKRNGKAATLCTGDGCRGQSTANFVFTKKMKTRKLTVRECANLQGIGNFDFSPWKDSVGYEAVGDGWEANMVREILRCMK